MDGINVIDQFLATFTRYIDSGFGLVGGQVRSLTATLVAIDVSLAGLLWALGGEDDVLARFIRKILYVGSFAFILNDFSGLANIIFNSFANLGLIAGGNTLSPADLLKPGRLAATGFDAAWPLLDQASKMMGFASFFQNFLTIMILLIAWLIIVIAFFILAVQLFVTILEFKLTTLAGFVLVPFAFWNRTSFLAERVLGSVVTSGVKVMVLTVIVGIGSGFFSQFIAALQGQEPDIGQAMSLVLASLSLLGLGIFGPTIAAGLVSGAPQLGAGAVLGTASLTVAGAALGGAASAAAARTIGGGLSAMRAGASLGTGARVTGASVQSDSRGQSSPAPSPNSAQSVAQGTGSPDQSTGGSAQQGTQDEHDVAVGARMPDWARSLYGAQRARQNRQIVSQTLREGDRGGAGAMPDISEKER